MNIDPSSIAKDAPLTEEGLQIALELLRSGGVQVQRPIETGSYKKKQRTKVPHKHEVGLAHLDSRDADLLHYPCISTRMTFGSRYVRRYGDLVIRTYVIRYSHLYEGYPVWHAAGVVIGADKEPKPRALWTRRDRRQMERLLDSRLIGMGQGPIYNGEEAGLWTEYADHRVRALLEEEANHYPQELLRNYEPVDLEDEKAKALEAVAKEEAERASATDVVPADS